MKKKKLLAVILSVALVAVVGVGATLAYLTDTDSKTNVIAMGKVDITLTEPEFTAANQNNTISNVKPNQEITKDPIITVEDGSLTSYLRAKITFEGLTDVQQADLLADDNIDIQTGWVLNTEDDYYYYQPSVDARTEVPLFTTVKIPENWGNEISAKTFKINVAAEAIQAELFTPAMDNIDGTDVITGWTDSKGTKITPKEFVAPVAS